MSDENDVKTFTCAKRFSIGFTSGLLGGIGTTVTPIRSISRFTSAAF